MESIASVTVVVTGSTSGGTVTLSSIQPNAGSAGTTVVLTGSGFSTTGNDIHFGIGGTRNVAAINSSTIYYTVPHYVSPCDFTVGLCSAPAVLVQNGSYPLYVTNAQGTSQTFTFTVNQ
ncbi:MAG: IPT/TIG domain-containing protein [Candidatus Pacebacteria bacterium]|nr:IPT/TIG domain-containing protein [Candidatus Paceibacterota bacterium]